MKTHMKQFKLNGHGYKKGRTWNMAHFLPKSRLAPLPAAPVQPQPGPSIADPLPQQKPEPTNPGNPQPAIQNPHSENGSGTSELRKYAPTANAISPEETPTVRENKTPELTGNETTRLNRNSTRTGKIARLPLDIREIVNGMLRGGFRYNDIVAHLNDLGHPGITPGNITFWKHHGYIEWLTHQHELEAQAVFAKSIEHCIRSLDVNHVQQTAIAFAADQLRQIMVKFDHRRALDLLHSRPELFPAFVSAMGTLSRCTSQLANAFDTNKTSETLLRQQPQPPPPLPRQDLEPEEDDDLQQDQPAPINQQNQFTNPTPAGASPTICENPGNPNQSQVI